MKHSNDYLYGEGAEVPEIPAEIIVRRIELLNEQLDELLSMKYWERDNDRLRAVLKAKDFWLDING